MGLTRSLDSGKKQAFFAGAQKLLNWTGVFAGVAIYGKRVSLAAAALRGANKFVRSCARGTLRKF
jgi:hypothetical protein